MAAPKFSSGTPGSLGMIALMACCSLGLMGHTLLDHNGWQRRSRLRADLQGLADKNSLLQQHVDLLMRDVEALQGRRQAQEHAVRDELGYVHGPSELVIHFEPAGTTAAD